MDKDKIENRFPTNEEMYQKLVEKGGEDFVVNFSMLVADVRDYDKLMDLLKKTDDLQEGVKIVRELADRILRPSLERVKTMQENNSEKFINVLRETIERFWVKYRMHQLKSEGAEMGNEGNLDKILVDMENSEQLEPIFAWKVGLGLLENYIIKRKGVVDEDLKQKILELIKKLSEFLKTDMTTYAKNCYLKESEDEYIKDWFKEDFWPQEIKKAFEEVIANYIK